MGVHDSIQVKDLMMPPGVRTKHDPESVVITVAGSMREEAATAPEQGEAAPAGSEPEVLKEKKKEEGADAAAGAGKAAGGAAGAGAAKKPDAAKKDDVKK